MKRKRAPSIPQRRPIFIGCEGESEVAYAGLLQALVQEAKLPVVLAVSNLGRGAGDPFARVQFAVKRLYRLAQTRIAPKERSILLDGDQAADDPGRAEQARDLAARHAIRIIWQEPCFEALLLRHLPDCETLRPPDTPKALDLLKKRWPDYRKALPRDAIAKQIDLAAVLRAAEVEPDLRRLLSCIGLIKEPR